MYKIDLTITIFYFLLRFRKTCIIPRMVPGMIMNPI